MRYLSIFGVLWGLLYAQDYTLDNVRFVGQLTYPYCNDIWGYNAPDGHEYALVGLANGVAIVDVTTNPSQPTEVGFVPGIQSGWRDLKVHDHYCYVTNETGGGLAIIDLADPAAPVLVGNYTQTFHSAHNIYIADGYAYIFGSNAGSGGVRILDLADPENPVEVGSWEVDYLHDGYVKNDTLYGAAIFTGTLYIIDVSDKANPVTLVAHQYSNYGCHQVWVTDDSKYAITADEKTGGHIIIWDIQDLNNITEVSSYSLDPMKTVHNAYYRDGMLVVSYYVFGTRFVDLSDPTAPVEVGYFDFFPGSEGLYNGNWGTFPYTNSGLVFSTDMNGAGLLIMSYPYIGEVSFEPLPDTENADDPVPLTVTVVENSTTPIDYSTLAVVAGLEGTTPDTVMLVATGNPGEYSGAIPAPHQAGTMQYYVTFHTIGGDIFTEPYGAPQSQYRYNVGPDFVLPVITYVSSVEDDFYPVGSRSVEVVATDNIGVATVEVVWQVNGGEEQTDTCTYQPQSDSYLGIIQWENLSSGDVITYFARVTDASSNQNVAVSEQQEFAIQSDYLLGDFETEEHLDRWILGQWGRQYINQEFGYGLNDSPNQTYEPNAFNPCYLAEPLNLTYFEHAYLQFTSLHILETDHDFGYVQVSTDQQNWTTLATVTGVWEIENVVVNLDSYLGNDQVYLRFLMTSDSLNEYIGWFIDDVHLVLNQEYVAIADPGEGALIPATVQLYPAHPNPFNPSTVIRYAVPKTGKITVTIYDLLGRPVANLVDAVQAKGRHAVRWNGLDESRRKVPSGVYLVVLQAGETVKTQKITLLR
jgi:choice-of-anchor B domain-containing protein